MIKRWVTLMSFGAALLAASPALAQLPSVQLDGQTPIEERDPEDVIRSQLAAFNGHNADALMANLHEGFAWFGVDSDITTLEMKGRDNFFKSMRDYFSSVPGARAEIEEIFVAGDFVTARERSYWRQGEAELSQASLAVYEIRNGLIYRVWYYPAFE